MAIVTQWAQSNGNPQPPSNSEISHQMCQELNAQFSFRARPLLGQLQIHHGQETLESGIVNLSGDHIHISAKLREIRHDRSTVESSHPPKIIQPGKEMKVFRMQTRELLDSVIFEEAALNFGAVGDSLQQQLCQWGICSKRVHGAQAGNRN
ncbi:hypothetical protein P7K49_024617 [Saguinus oedipus]|uniref:Uncharacterized protein n=1 Tax=Saguinus oedipus TaxID=9490 RepID=A0ABQ9UQ06_SAGOE|nr:hypothetical protein P7K49_024617 [Saguinus oedipus]